MDFRILGPLCIAHDGVELTPTAPKMKQVLAFLLVRPGKLVKVSELIDELWGEHPPYSAMTTLQTYIYKLRKDVLHRCGTVGLHTRSVGYVLDVSPEHGDAQLFERMCDEGRKALEQGEAAQAAQRLADALAVWTGPALADVTTGEILSAHVTRLEEERLSALAMRITADLELGRYQQLVSELRMLVAEHPLDERFYAYLMRALHGSGRRYEALEVYQTLRSTLVSELGSEPSAGVQRLHVSLLEDSDVPANSDPRRTQLGGVANAHPKHSLVPAQLPRDLPDFVGREEVLRDIGAYLMPAGVSRPMATVRDSGRILCVTGMPGVGKSALALRAAYLARGESSDGQFYADLKGSTSKAADPRQILHGFLQAIGTHSDAIPDGLEESTKLFRTWSASRKVLLVLDDVHSVRQVEPLLPTSPTCAVILTTCRGLYTLPGTHHVHLDLLSTAEAVDLLETVSRRSYRGAERTVAERVVRLAGRLPFALRALGARLMAAPALALGRLALQLEDPRRRLDLLSFADLNLRGRFDASYQQLDGPDRDAFILVSMLSQWEFSATMATRLIGKGSDTVEAQLARLAGLNLLSVLRTARGGELRYRMHDLLNIYAREHIEDSVTPTHEESALLLPELAQAPSPRQLRAG